QPAIHQRLARWPSCSCRKSIRQARGLTGCPISFGAPVKERGIDERQSARREASTDARRFGNRHRGSGSRQRVWSVRPFNHCDSGVDLPIARTRLTGRCERGDPAKPRLAPLSLPQTQIANWQRTLLTFLLAVGSFGDRLACGTAADWAELMDFPEMIRSTIE